MFPTIKTDIVDRVFRVAHFAAEACDSTHNPLSAVASKGLVFVQLYAVYEHAIVDGVLAGLTQLQVHGMAFRDVRHELLSIVLGPELQSAAEAGLKKKWRSRRELFRRSMCSDAVTIPAKHFPGDDSHFRRPQLETIWELFGITSPVVPQGQHFSLIEELVEHRNAIAHGRERPEAIGGRYSIGEIEKRIAWTRDLSLHIVTELETHCANPANLRR